MAWMPVLEPTSSSTTQWILDPLNTFFQVQPRLPAPIQPFSVSTDQPLSPLTELDSDFENPQSPQSPLGKLSPPFPSLSSRLASTVDFSALLEIITTNFNPSLKENLTPPYPRDKDFDRYPLTQRERERASKAVTVTGLSQFATIVCNFVYELLIWYLTIEQLQKQLEFGFKKDPDTYLRIDSNQFDGYVSLLTFLILSNTTYRRILRINDVSQDLLALVCTNMPDVLKSHLLDAVRLIYPSLIKHTESEAEGNTDSFFHALHFDWYNRYSTLVRVVTPCICYFSNMTNRAMEWI